jgi:hypothetical protein
MKKIRRKPARKQQPFVLFTLDTLAMMQEALCLFENKLAQTPNDSRNAAFAEQVLPSLHKKLRSLVDEYDPTKKISFDYNEVVILSGSLQMYHRAVLELQAPSPQADKQTRECQALIIYFHRLMRLPHIKKN